MCISGTAKGMLQRRQSLSSLRELQQKDERQMNEKSQLTARENSIDYKKKGFYKESG